MIIKPVDLFFNIDVLGESSEGLVLSKIDDQDRVYSFTEGDTYPIRVHLRKNYDNDSSTYHQLDDEHELILLSASIDNAVDELVHISYSNKFDEVADEDGDICYEGVLDFATQSAIDILSTNSSVTLTLELVIRDKIYGTQRSLQGEISLHASLLKGAVKEVTNPSIHIGSYSSVVSIANGIVDKRILDLRAGAPLEFDTLYELAHFAQKVRSHEVVTGDFCDYLDGKKLADQNLTVVSLGNIMMSESTYSVSYEPWRPKEVTAEVVE